MSQSKHHLEEKVNRFLKEKDTGAFATHGNDIRVSPVKYFVDEKNNIYIHSNGGSKFDNLERKSEACLLVSTEFGDDLNRVKGVQIFGHCEIGENGSPLYEEADRYCPWNYDLDSAVIKLTPDQIVYKDGITEDGSKQVLRL